MRRIATGITLASLLMIPSFSEIEKTQNINQSKEIRCNLPRVTRKNHATPIGYKNYWLSEKKCYSIRLNGENHTLAIFQNPTGYGKVLENYENNSNYPTSYHFFLGKETPNPYSPSVFKIIFSTNENNIVSKNGILIENTSTKHEKGLTGDEIGVMMEYPKKITNSKS